MNKHCASAALVITLLTFTVTACSSPKTLQLAYPATQQATQTGTLGITVDPHAYDGYLLVDKQRVSLKESQGVHEVIVQNVPVGNRVILILTATGETRSRATALVTENKITNVTIRGASGSTAGTKAAAGIGTVMVILSIAAVALVIWLFAAIIDSVGS